MLLLSIGIGRWFDAVVVVIDDIDVIHSFVNYYIIPIS